MQSEDGTIAVIFAFLLIPLMIFVGVAVDSIRVTNAALQLQRALDSAALAGGRMLTLDAGERDAIINAYFSESLGDAKYSVYDVNVTITPNITDNTIEVSATARVKTSIMPILGQDYVNIGMSSEAVRGDSTLEIALALDVSESMSTSKMNALKTAATDLIDVLYPDGDDEKIQTSIIPWDQIVTLRGALNDTDKFLRALSYTNAGGSVTNNTTANEEGYNVTLPCPWGSCYTNCVSSCHDGSCGTPDENRYDEYKVTCPTGTWTGEISLGNTEWSSSGQYYTESTQRWYPPYWWSTTNFTNDELNVGLHYVNHGRRCEIYYYRSSNQIGHCYYYDKIGPREMPLIPLTDKTARLKSNINNLAAREVIRTFRRTSSPMGVYWAWRTLSPKWRGEWKDVASGFPKDYDDDDNNKALVLMTDGQNNLGLQNENQLAKDQCTRMKDLGIRIYTVGFALDGLPATDKDAAIDMLSSCASSSGNFFYTPDASTLKAAFKAIAIDLASLRLQR